MKRKFTIPVLVFGVLLLTVSAVSAAVLNFRAHLSGQYQIPFIVDTKAQGQAVFQVLDDDLGLGYMLNVAKIDNVTMAHIHLMPASGSGNGPIIAWLYPDAPPALLIPGTSNGVLASGVISDQNVLIDYNADGVKDINDLVEAIEAGDTYVNVHTQANPGGEIHGPVD